MNYTLFILFSVKYFENTLLYDKIVQKDQKYFINTFFLFISYMAAGNRLVSISEKYLLAPSALA